VSVAVLSPVLMMVVNRDYCFIAEIASVVFMDGGRPEEGHEYRNTLQASTRRRHTHEVVDNDAKASLIVSTSDLEARDLPTRWVSARVYTLLVTASAALGSLLFGYDTGVIAGTKS